MSISIIKLCPEALEASCGGGRTGRKGTLGCQKLLMKQIGNLRLANDEAWLLVKTLSRETGLMFWGRSP